MKLKRNQYELFAQAYAKSGKCYKAAIKAGYSKKTASAQASRLLKNVKIISRVKELMELVEDKTIMSIAERKRKLSTLGRADLSDVMVCPPDGHPTISFDEETPNKGAVASLEQIIVKSDDSIEVRNRKIKMHDPIKAIAELNKMDGAYAKSEIDITSNGESIVSDINVTFRKPKESE